MVDIKKLIDEMTVEELCGQVLAYDIQPNDSEEETLKTIEKIKPGTLFMCGVQKNSVEELTPFFEKTRKFSEYATQVTKVPCMVATDIENGPGSYDHAGKYESSILMSLYPECVKKERIDDTKHWFTESAREASKEIGDEMVEKSLAYLKEAIK